MAKAAADKPDWSPPAVNDDGHELHGDYPVSGPARALALGKAGRKTDPDGILTPEQIAAVNAGDVPTPAEDGSTVDDAPVPPRARTASKPARTTTTKPARAARSTRPRKARPAASPAVATTESSSAEGSDA